MNSRRDQFVVAIIFALIAVSVATVLPHVRDEIRDEIEQRVFKPSVRIYYRIFKPSVLNDEAAMDVGRQAKIMQEVFWNDHHDREHYTSELVDLLAYDRTLTHDPSVTFEFLHASISRYTFTTRHANGNTTYTWTD